MNTPVRSPRHSPFAAAWRRFRHEKTAMLGVGGILLVFAVAVLAPLLANRLPLVMRNASGVSFPFLQAFFAPDSPEYLIEQLFNYALLFSLPLGLFYPFRRHRAARGLLAAAALLGALPFFLARPVMDKENYRERAARGEIAAVFAPIPYGPFENIGEPRRGPSKRHLFGTDEIGRDVAARMIYGARVSLAVGLGATLLSLGLGTLVGLAAGYFRGLFDLVTMRVVEIVMCFPTFLLLLILMAILYDRKFEQSILVVIAVIGLTGWIGLAILVRGEVLKQRALPYIQSGIVAGIPARRIMLAHLLPNITWPILISFTFGVAGAILAESGLSFLGFGVKAPTASWGGMLRQAFDDPMSYWHLTFFPGAALFLTLCSFNFTGEGLRKALAVK